MAVLLITHDLGVVAETCDRVPGPLRRAGDGNGRRPHPVRPAGAPVYAGASRFLARGRARGRGPAAVHRRAARRRRSPAGRRARPGGLPSARAARAPCRASARSPCRPRRRAGHVVRCHLYPPGASFDAPAFRREPPRPLPARAGAGGARRGRRQLLSGAARRWGWWASPAAARAPRGAPSCRLLAPTAGRVVFDGRDVLAVGAGEMRLRRRLQMVFQDPFASLSPRMTVEQIVAEPLEIHRLSGGGGSGRHGWGRCSTRWAFPPTRRGASPRDFRRPAPAHRHRAGAGPRPGLPRPRRAGFGARHLGARAVVNLLQDLQERRASRTCSSATTCR